MMEQKQMPSLVRYKFQVLANESKKLNKQMQRNHGVGFDGSMILDYLPNYKPKYVKNTQYFKDQIQYYDKKQRPVP